MKRTINWIASVSLLVAISITGCKKDNPDAKPGPAPGAYETGIFITNEGPFLSGSGTVSFYNRSTGAVSQDIFQTANGFPIGNILNSLTIYNGKGYIVVNNANKVEVVNAGDFKSTATITGLNLPRYFLGVNSTKGYVTEWGPTGMEGAVQVIDLSTNTITNTISTGKGAEYMLKAGNLLYVTCRGGYDNDSVVTVINTANDAVLTTINVGPNPNGIEQDANGKIWVLCGGKWNDFFTELEKPGRLVKIDPATNTVEQSFVFTSLFSTPSNLCINSAKNELFYVYNGGIFKQQITAPGLSANAFINKNFYGLGIDPANNFVYGADAGNFSSNGYVFRYTSSGTAVDSFQVGVIPGNFFFK